MSAAAEGDSKLELMGELEEQRAAALLSLHSQPIT